MARDENSNGHSGSNEYLSVSDAASRVGIDVGVIRRAIKAGAISTKRHPWGLRVLLSDVTRYVASSRHAQPKVAAD